MKIEDPRVTDYALGELRAAACEEFEKELAQSEELQRELEETALLCGKLGALPLEEQGFEEETRMQLREECLRNVRIVRRERNFRRVAWAGALGALAACLLLAPLIPWTAVLSRSPMRDKQQRSADLQVVPQREESTPASKQGQASTSQLVAKSAPATAAVPPNEQGRGLTGLPAQTRLESTTVTSVPTAKAAAPGAPSAQPASAASHTSGKPIGVSMSGLGQGLGSGMASGSDKESRRFKRVTDEEFNTEAYDEIQENRFRDAKDNPLSTFSIDVDTASYSNVRRFLRSDQLPPSGAVRTEELINYFFYDYPDPEAGNPFSVNIEVNRAPWNLKHELVRVGLKGRSISVSERPSSNLVFLIDVSGSMRDEAKLPLLRRSLRALVDNLLPEDRVAIVVYAGSSGLVLPSTKGENKDRILKALDELEAGGSTNGAEGIRLAYQTARENFLRQGNNRVILCTDGDFNVGVTNQSELISLIEKERSSGVFLSVLGFGTGNLKDSTMEKLADKGNGNYSYIDSLTEGRKVLVEQMGSTLFTIAKDVKVQVEFNPALVAGYRLIGYENRLLAKEDFNDDKKDAGEIGAGHTVTALYEIVPAGQTLPDKPAVDPLKYQAPAVQRSLDELLTVKLRYKARDGDTSRLIESPVQAPTDKTFDQASKDFQFAAAVAAFGMKLRRSPDAGEISWEEIQRIARKNLGEDPGSYRAEFLTLVEKARQLGEAQSQRGDDIK
ncbi:MAG TPA: VWA domain-containing protein [Terrimicrobiaceae bacterium]